MKTVITGMGCMSSLGNSVNEMYEGLLQNKSGVRFYPEWKDKNGLHAHLGAPVPEYNIKQIPRTTRRTMSRMSEMAALATFVALAGVAVSIHGLLYYENDVVLSGAIAMGVGMLACVLMLTLHPKDIERHRHRES